MTRINPQVAERNRALMNAWVENRRADAAANPARANAILANAEGMLDQHMRTVQGCGRIPAGLLGVTAADLALAKCVLSAPLAEVVA